MGLSQHIAISNSIRAVSRCDELSSGVDRGLAANGHGYTIYWVVCCESLGVIASRYLLADASLRIVFLACKNPELKYAGDGTSVNRIHESGCGFALC